MSSPSGVIICSKTGIWNWRQSRSRSVSDNGKSLDVNTTNEWVGSTHAVSTCSR